MTLRRAEVPTARGSVGRLADLSGVEPADLKVRVTVGTVHTRRDGSGGDNARCEMSGRPKAS